MAPYKLIHSPNRYNTRRAAITRIGIHCTQSPQDTAPGIANYFAKPASQASAHIVIDNDEVIQCVKLAETAWAMPHVNADGFHVEICGYAEWTHDEWFKGKGKLGLMWGACVVAEFIQLMRFLGTPFDVRELSDSEVVNHRGLGLIRHSTASRLLKPNHGHTDPGIYFPMREFIDGINWWLPNIKDIKIQ